MKFKKKPFIEVITEDDSGDGFQFNTYRVNDVFRTNRVKVGQLYSYDQLLRLSNSGIGFEILDEFDYSDIR